jgi:hypothetical protein
MGMLACYQGRQAELQTHQTSVAPMQTFRAIANSYIAIAFPVMGLAILSSDASLA